MIDDVILRRAETPADYRALQDAQRSAWGVTEESYIVPIATMVGAQMHGGLVLGAFLPSGEAVAVSFAFLGRIGGRTCLYSQLTGSTPAYQGKGLGSRLKYMQRDHCRAEGIPVIAWAFDPMQAGNAAFNFQKLGVTSNRIVFNMYGPRSDRLNAAGPTDRMIVDWELDASPRPEPSAEEMKSIVKVIAHDRGEGAWTGHPDLPEARRCLLEIPDSITALRAQNPSLAEYWQVCVTNALCGLFEWGYRAVGFVRGQGATPFFPGHYYLLEKDRPV